MRTKIQATLLTMMVCAASVAAISASAAESRTCPLTPRSIAAERDAERRLADETRVVDWLAHRILDDVADRDLVLDISAEDVRKATGVDASTLDADRLRSRVSMKLRELAVGPTEAEPGEPDAAAPVTTPEPAAPCTEPARAAAPAPASSATPDATPTAEGTPASATGGGLRRATDSSSTGRATSVR